MNILRYIPFLCLFASVASAQISLPLQGYYRPDRYMPVQVPSQGATLSTEGTFPTIVQPSPHSSIVPLLIHGQPRSLNSLPLHQAESNERLIACISITQPNIATLFPTQKTLPILLDTSDPLPGPPAAWEALDAIVLDTATMDRLDDDHRSAFLAADITLAVTDKIRPDLRWPWKWQGGLWVLQHHSAGPSDSLVDQSVFPPMPPLSWPAELRMQIFAAGVLLAIATLSLTLWRSKATTLFIVALAMVACFAVIGWRDAQSIVSAAGGNIVVNSNDLFQRDRWAYLTARSSGIAQFPWDGSTHPVFASQDQIDRSEMSLRVGPTGRLWFQYHPQRGQTIAFLQREIFPGTQLPAAPTRFSPMTDLAQQLYLQPGAKLIGQEPAPSIRWPGVIIQTTSR